MSIRHQRWIGLGALCTALVAVCAALSVIGLSPGGARAGTTASPCSASQTQVWIGLGGGGGYAGGYGMPLEFSNTGQQPCALLGYPGVSAVRAARQIGPAGTRIRAPFSAVTLAPGATAHALLKVIDTGALCGSSGVNADAVRIYAPGQRAAKQVLVAVKVCARRAALAVGPVRPGVGIPGYIAQ